jgi:hypothetical protein
MSELKLICSDAVRAGDRVLLDGEWVETLSVYDHSATLLEVHVPLSEHGWEVAYVPKDKILLVQRDE